MAIIKCKMCGGDVELSPDKTFGTCDSCGRVQTVPTADNEKKLALFARANRLRVSCDFDKAAGIYESILADFPEEAEAYWGLVLCKYGIEYVDDPATGKKVPTCHRSSYDSVLDDSNFEQAIENADMVAQKLYREEAKEFERIRKGILAVSSAEKPYDIFICYKETAPNGDRTLDSVMAQDLYGALTAKGYRVFFSRITLQGKLGEAYEPYIFAALNSAKVMLAVGTCYEHYNAVWVKNEWSRYLKICEADNSKHLIPCFKDLDPEDMPREFSHLQGADLGKMGAIQDILFNMEKYIPLQKQNTAVIQERVVVGGAAANKVAALLDRGNMALEDGDWIKADSFFEDVLNNDSKNAQAYLGKTLAQEKCRTIDAFIRKRLSSTLSAKTNTLHLQPDLDHIQSVVDKYRLPGYVDSNAMEQLFGYNLSYASEVASRMQQHKDELAYWATHRNLSSAEKFAVGAVAENLQKEKASLLAQLTARIKSAQEKEAAAAEALKTAYAAHLVKADTNAEAMFRQGLARRDQNYTQWCAQSDSYTEPSLLYALGKSFDSLGDYKDSCQLAEHCRTRAAQEQEKLDEAARQRRIAEEKAAAARRKKGRLIAIISITAMILAIATTLVIVFVVIPAGKRDDARALMAAGSYEEAYAILREMDDSESTALMKQVQTHGDYLVTEITDEETVNTYTFLYNAQGNPLTVTMTGSEAQVYSYAYTYYPSGNPETVLLSKEDGTPLVGFRFLDSEDAGMVFDPFTPLVHLGPELIISRVTNLFRYEQVTQKTGYTDGAESYTVTYADGFPTQITYADGRSPLVFQRDGSKLRYYNDSGKPNDITYNEYGHIAREESSSYTYDTTLTYKGGNLTQRLTKRGEKEMCNDTATYDKIGRMTAYIHRTNTSTYATTVKNNMAITWQWLDLDQIARDIAAEEARLAAAYSDAKDKLEAGDYDGAIAQFTSLAKYSDSPTMVLEATYRKACNRFDSGDYAAAMTLLRDLGDYADCAARLPEAAYLAGQAYLAQEEFGWAAIAFGTAGSYQDARAQASAMWAFVAPQQTIGATNEHSVAVKTDGTVVAVGSNDSGCCELSNWSSITSIAVSNDWIGGDYTIGLRSDGTLMSVGSNDDGERDVMTWRNIVAISTYDGHTVGLKSDGTAVATGSNSKGQCDVEGWTDLIAIAAGDSYTVGLKADGTVVATGDNYSGKCEVSQWTDIVAISAGYSHTVGLKADGTVVATGSNREKACDVSGWAGIVKVVAGYQCTIGIRLDGTVVATGDSDYGRLNVSKWKNVVAVAAGPYHTIALCADGTLVCTGSNDNGKMNIRKWTDILLDRDAKYHAQYLLN